MPNVDANLYSGTALPASHALLETLQPLQQVPDTTHGRRQDMVYLEVALASISAQLF